METDKQLIEDYLAGKYEAFETLYMRHKDGVYRYLARQLTSPAVVDDVFQEVWSNIVTKLADFRNDANFTTWMYTIARHKLIDYIRHLGVIDKNIDRHTNILEDSIVDQHESPENQQQAFEQSQAFDSCLALLPQHQKDCFLLKEESDLTAKEIAIIVNTGLEATKSRLRTAYAKLKECLQRKLQSPKQNDLSKRQQS